MSLASILKTRILPETEAFTEKRFASSISGFNESRTLCGLSVSSLTSAVIILLTGRNLSGNWLAHFEKNLVTALNTSDTTGRISCLRCNFSTVPTFVISHYCSSFSEVLTSLGCSASKSSTFTGLFTFLSVVDKGA